MTKKWQLMPVADALYEGAKQYPGGIGALAELMGKSEKVLRSKLAPDLDSHHITLEEALQIIEHLDGRRPTVAQNVMKAIGHRLHRVITRQDGVDSTVVPLTVQALWLTAQTGILGAHLSQYFQFDEQDQPLTKKQADELHDQLSKVLLAVYTLMDSVEQRTEAKS